MKERKKERKNNENPNSGLFAFFKCAEIFDWMEKREKKFSTGYKGSIEKGKREKERRRRRDGKIETAHSIERGARRRKKERKNRQRGKWLLYWGGGKRKKERKKILM